jgi:hypothetical protein
VTLGELVEDDEVDEDVTEAAVFFLFFGEWMGALDCNDFLTLSELFFVLLLQFEEDDEPPTLNRLLSENKVLGSVPNPSCTYEQGQSLPFLPPCIFFLNPK